MSKNNLILFTSLPKVGGHSTITLGLCSLLRPHFDEIEVWCKTMPDHGHSGKTEEALRDLGCRVVRISNDLGRIKPAVLFGLLARSLIAPPRLFFALAMRNLSTLLALLLRPENSIYYHITHDLNERTIRRLRQCQQSFQTLAFICPATLEGYEEATKFQNPRPVVWVPQPSEIPVQNPEKLVEEKANACQSEQVFRFGLIGRLTEAKGARVMLEFLERTRQPCELHVAGAGPLADEFRVMAEKGGGAGRVKFLGAYEPTEREVFLRRFFTHIDCLVVPSLDEWETLSMAALEGFQHGVPSIICRTGGLVSFAHPSLGPAPGEVVRLVEPSLLSSELEKLASVPRPDFASTTKSCLSYYNKFFANRVIEQQWLDLVGKPGRGKHF